MYVTSRIQAAVGVKNELLHVSKLWKYKPTNGFAPGCNRGWSDYMT